MNTGAAAETASAREGETLPSRPDTSGAFAAGTGRPHVRSVPDAVTREASMGPADGEEPGARPEISMDAKAAPRPNLSGMGAREAPATGVRWEKAGVDTSNAEAAGEWAAGEGTVMAGRERVSPLGSAGLEQAPSPPAPEAPVDGRAPQGLAADARRFEAVARGSLEQMVRRVEGEIDGDNASLRMHLAPDRLGDLQLKIELERGLLTARFVAASEEVKAMIESALPDLRRHLADQGVMVQELSVSVGERQGEGPPGGSAGRQRHASAGSPSGVPATGSAYEAARERQAPLSTEALVDLVV